MKKLIITEATQNQRLDKYLKRYFPNAGQGFLYRMLREKKIKLNGKKAEGKTLLAAGDEITVYFSEETLETFMRPPEGKTPGNVPSAEGNPKKPVSGHRTDPEAWDFGSRIIYEDAQVLFWNKPAGLLSQKSAVRDVSACELLVDYLVRKKEATEESLREYRPSAVNRLDRNTSGLLICAKTLAAARTLSDLLRSRELKKEYLAMVRGRVEEAMRVSAWLKKEADGNRVQVCGSPREGFERIETAYTPLGFLAEEDCTLLNVELVTGKTHQIRAHLAYLGHPLAGDPKYGRRHADRLFARKYGLTRQFLHAYRLTFPALSGVLKALGNRSFTAALPEELETIERLMQYVI